MCRHCSWKPFQQSCGLLLKSPRRFGEPGDVILDFVKGGQLATAQFIPVLLMDAEQLNEQKHSVVFA